MQMDVSVKKDSWDQEILVHGYVTSHFSSPFERIRHLTNEKETGPS